MPEPRLVGRREHYRAGEVSFGPKDHAEATKVLLDEIMGTGFSRKQFSEYKIIFEAHSRN